MIDEGRRGSGNDDIGPMTEEKFGPLKPFIEAFQRGETPLDQLWELVDAVYGWGELHGYIAGRCEGIERLGMLPEEWIQKLTETQLGIVWLLKKGLDYEQIAADPTTPHMTPEGVRWHVKDAAKRLGLSGVRELKTKLGAPLRHSREGHSDKEL